MELTAEQWALLRDAFDAASASGGDSHGVTLERAAGDAVVARQLAELLGADQRIRSGELPRQVELAAIAPVLAEQQSMTGGGQQDGFASPEWDPLDLPDPEVAEELPRMFAGMRLLRRLAGGSGGRVYLAQDAGGKSVAVKLLHASTATRQGQRRFRVEVDALRRLRHPNITAVLNHGVATDVPAPGADGVARGYIVTEYVEGCTIGAFVRQHNLDLRAVVVLVQQAAAAVQHAHQQGVLHRDLKPANILVAGEGADAMVKVIDFGIARLTDATASLATTTQALGPMGTPMFMSPEQATGTAEAVDTRSDVYALGVVLYHLLTLQGPVDLASKTIGQIAAALGSMEPRSLRRLRPNVPPELSWVALKAVARLPNDRYGTAGELAADLQRWLEGRPVSLPPPSVIAGAMSFVRRNRAASALGAATLVTLIGATIAVSISAGKLARAQDDAREAATALLNEVATLLPDRLGAEADLDRVISRLEPQIKGFIERYPSDGKLQRDYARLLRLKGDALERVGRAAEALPALERSATILQRLRREKPALVSAADVSIALVRVGDQHRQLRQDEKGGEYYLAALAIDQEVAAAEPNSARAISNLLYSHQRLAILCRDLAEYPLGTRHVNLQADLADRLVLLYPGAPGTLRELASAYSNLRLFDEDPATRLRILAMEDRLVDARRRLLELQPESRSARLQLISELLTATKRAVDNSSPGVISGWFDEGCALLEEAAAVSPQDPEVLRLQIVRHSIESDRAATGGNIAEAIALRETNLGTVERFAAAGGSRSETLEHRVTQLMQTRELYLRAGRRERYATLRDETAAYARSLLQTPADAQAARRALLRLATELAAASDDRTEALQSAVEVAARSPKDPWVVAALRLCHLRVGDEERAASVWREYTATNPDYRVARAGDEFALMLQRAVQDGQLPARLLPGS